MNTKTLLTTGLLALLLILGGSPVFAGDAKTGTEKVVFHLDETINARWAMMLANSYLDDSPKTKIVIVAYGPGVDFLLHDAEDGRGNPYDPAVINLVEKGVEFRVCAGTLSARSIAKEDVLDVAKIVPSGVSEIVRLQINEGFAYLKP